MMGTPVKVLFTVTGNDKVNGKPFSNQVSYNFSFDQAEYGQFATHDARLMEKCEKAAGKLCQAFTISGNDITVTYEVQ